MKHFNYSLTILPLLSILAMPPSDIQLKTNYRSIASAIPEVQKEVPKPELEIHTKVFQVEDKKEDIKKDEVVNEEPKKEEEVKKDEVVKEEPKKEEEEVKKDEVAKEEPKKEEEVKKDEVAKDESKKEDKKSDQEKLICDLEEKNKALTKQMEQLMADQKQIMQTMLGMNQMMVSMFQQQQNPWQPYMNSLGMQSVYQYAPQTTAGNWVYYPQGVQPSQPNIFSQQQMPAFQGGMYPDQMHMQQSNSWGLRPQMNFDSASFMMQPQPAAGNFGGEAMGFNFGPQAQTLSYLR